MRLLVTIPALNEEKNLGLVLDSIPTCIEGISEVAVLVVDDGSEDQTAAIAKAAGAEVIRHPFNIGLGVSFGRGVQYALEGGFDIMVNIDGDGQFDPQDIPKLIRWIQDDEADFVTASRFIVRGSCPQIPRVKLWGNKAVSYLVSKLIRRKFRDVSCGFRAYSREALLSLNLQGSFTYTQETFLDLAFKRLRIVEVPVKVQYFSSRRSRVASNLFSYGVKTAKIVFRTYRDYKPLRFFVGIGGFFFIAAVFFEAILLWTFLTTGAFTPNIWSGFVGAIFFALALMLFVVGILADMNTRTRVNQEKILYHLRKGRGVGREL